MVFPADESFPSLQPLPLQTENAEIFKSLLNRHSFTTNHEPLLNHADLDRWLHNNRWLVVPLYLRQHPVGLLFVEDSEGPDREQEATLMTVANQAALALGTTILCIDRARRLGVETERNANFIVNTGGASASDVLALIGHARALVRLKTGIQLEPEVKIWGRGAPEERAW